MRTKREIEICAETLQACEAARDGGADRIELCSALGEGGVTPSDGLVDAALHLNAPPIHVLIRPRAGNFRYSKAEFAVMSTDLVRLLGLGAAGAVLGCLTDTHEIDQVQIRQLVELAGDKPVTFHRAFDHTRDLHRSLETLVALGCSRVLTSGGRPSVEEGIQTLRSCTVQARGRIRIAAGGGVSLLNAARLCQIPGLDLHASLRRTPHALELKDVLWQETGNGSIDLQDVRRFAAIGHAQESISPNTLELSWPK